MSYTLIPITSVLELLAWSTYLADSRFRKDTSSVPPASSKMNKLCCCGAWRRRIYETFFPYLSWQIFCYISNTSWILKMFWRFCPMEWYQILNAVVVQLMQTKNLNTNWNSLEIPANFRRLYSTNIWMDLLQQFWLHPELTRQTFILKLSGNKSIISQQSVKDWQ